MFRAGDIVRVTFIDAVLHPQSARHLRSGTIRKLRAAYKANTFVMPYDVSDSFGLVVIRNGVFVPGITFEHYDELPSETKDDTEGNRMLRFFKASAHDPDSQW